MRAILVYLLAGLLGHVIAECFELARRVEAKLLKVLAWVGTLYLALFAILYLAAVLIGIAVGSVIAHMSWAKRDGVQSAPQRPASGVAVALVWAVAIPLLIIVSDFGQFVFDLRRNPASYATAVALFAVFGLVCALLASRLRRTWIAWVVGVLPILLYYNSWVAVPLLTAYIFGCRLGWGDTLALRRRSPLVALCVLQFVATACFDGYMQPYTLEGYGAFFPDHCGPALHGALMFPWLFVTGALLTQLGEARKAHLLAVPTTQGQIQPL